MIKRISKDDLEHILSNTRDVFEQIRGKKIFLTGGTGFFGKWLLESFIYINQQMALNASITVLSRNPTAFIKDFPFYAEHPSVTFIQGDVINFSFPAEKFDYIIHAATERNLDKNIANILPMLDTITIGTRHVLDFALQNPVTSFLYISSGAVYGKQPENVSELQEDAPSYINSTDPVSAYAEGKKLAELYCSLYHYTHKLPVKIARCFAFLGPHLPLNKHFAVGNFILDAISSRDIIVKGDGTAYRSYLYASDLAIWLWTILIKGEVNTPYNVGSDKAYTIKEIAELVAKTKPLTGVQILGKSNPGKGIERYIPCVSRAGELGLRVNISIESAIEKTRIFYER